MTKQELFDNALVDILREYRGNQLLSIPGIYEILSEHFNNDALTLMETKRDKAATWD